MRNSIVTYIAGLAVIIFSLHPLAAQEDLNQEVKVFKPYEPSVSDAFKINKLPVINDTLKIVPDFEYVINTKQFKTGFEIEPIKPAKMVGEPLSKLYNCYIKLGIGNHIAPLAEINVNNLHSKYYSFGAYLKHMSSYGKVSLDNEERVPAGYSDNKLRLYGKRIFDNSILSGEVGFSSDRIMHYGYNTAIDTTLNRSDINHTYNNFGVNTAYQSTYKDSAHVNKHFEFDYNYFRDDMENEENEVVLTANLNKFFEAELIGADVQLFHHQRDRLSDTLKPTIIRFSPWLGLFGNKWRVVAGLNFFTNDGEDNGYFYPMGSLQYDIISHYLIPYVDVGGKLEINNFKKIASENMFLISGLYVKNTDHKMIISAGIKGNFSSSVFYNFNATYSIIDNMYFFVNDVVNTDSVGNYFNVVYDNIELTRYFGELSIKASGEMDFYLRCNFYKYKMSIEAKPWHKPLFDFTISGKYSLGNKIIVDADIYAITESYAKSNNPSLPYITLNGIVDFNIGAEYRYSKILSGFVKFNNISGTRYARWNQFPLQRFNMMLGITYAL